MKFFQIASLERIKIPSVYRKDRKRGSDDDTWSDEIASSERLKIPSISGNGSRRDFNDDTGFVEIASLERIKITTVFVGNDGRRGSDDDFLSFLMMRSKQTRINTRIPSATTSRD